MTFEIIYKIHWFAGMMYAWIKKIVSRQLLVNFYLFRKISISDFPTTSGAANTSPKQEPLSGT